MHHQLYQYVTLHQLEDVTVVSNLIIDWIDGQELIYPSLVAWLVIDMLEEIGLPVAKPRRKDSTGMSIQMMEEVEYLAADGKRSF